MFQDTDFMSFIFFFGGGGVAVTLEICPFLHHWWVNSFWVISDYHFSCNWQFLKSLFSMAIKPWIPVLVWLCPVRGKCDHHFGHSQIFRRTIKVCQTFDGLWEQLSLWSNAFLSVHFTTTLAKKIETNARTWHRRVICRACTRLCLACVPVSIFLARVVVFTFKSWFWCTMICKLETACRDPQPQVFT